MSYVDLSKYNYLKIPANDTWGLLLRRDDPLAQKEAFHVQELKGLPLICSKQWADHEFPQWFGISTGEANIVATYNLAYNGSVMVKSGIGCAIVLDHLIDTSPASGLIFRPLLDVPQLEMYMIWRKYQTFTPVAELLMKMLLDRFQ